MVVILYEKCERGVKKKARRRRFFEKFYARFFKIVEKTAKSVKKHTPGVIFFMNSNALKIDENGEIWAKNGLKTAFLRVFGLFYLI